MIIRGDKGVNLLEMYENFFQLEGLFRGYLVDIY